MEGTIKKVVRDRGFGFINGQEVFFHRSGFQGLDFDSVREGQHVQYEVELGEKGPRAVRIRASVA
jgi:CspA family cold shock protein